MDSVGRTSLHTLLAQATLVEVDIAEVILYCDSLELTLLHALAATDTSRLTCLHGSRTLVLVHTTHIDATILGTFLAQFDNTSRTSLYTGTTRSTLIIVHLRDSRFRVDPDSIKLTGGHTVAAAQTTVATSRLTCTCGVHSSTSEQTIVFSNLRTEGAGAVTTHHGHHRISGCNGHSQQIGRLTHHVCTAHRTVQSFQRSSIGSLH